MAAPVGEKSATAALREVEKTYDGRESENGEREGEKEKESSCCCGFFNIGFKFSFNF